MGRPHYCSTLNYFVRFEVVTAMTMKNVVFWDVTPCGCCMNRRFGGTYRFHHQGDKNRRGRKMLAASSNRSTGNYETIVIPYCNPTGTATKMKAKETLASGPN
jgi:hypothetical protein